MKKQFILPILLLTILIAGYVLLFALPNKTKAPVVENTPVTASIPDLISVSSPTVGAKVGSPLSVTGQARGTWYFEASAPIELLDAAGKSLAIGHLQATGDWMTTEYVPFTGELSFPPQPAGATGTLVLKNDNPSGDPAREKKLQIPVTF